MMSRKVLIGLLIFLLLLTAGAGIYYMTGDQSRAVNTGETKGSPSEPLFKLAYVGTNETLSEALYHLDLQDGKLDDSHIVVTIKKINETDARKSKITRFIDKNNKVQKEMVFPYNYDVDIAENGKYAMVMEKVIKPEWNTFNVKYYYYDWKGDLLWKFRETGGRFKPSPDGLYLVKREDSRFPEGNIWILDNRGNTLYDETLDELIYFKRLAFSPGGKYCLMLMEDGARNYQQIFYVFDSKGKRLARIERAPLLYPKQLILSKEGDKIYFWGHDKDFDGSEERQYLRTIQALDLEGKEIFKLEKENVNKIVVSPNEKYMAIACFGSAHLIDLGNNRVSEIQLPVMPQFNFLGRSFFGFDSQDNVFLKMGIKMPQIRWALYRRSDQRMQMFSPAPDGFGPTIPDVFLKGNLLFVPYFKIGSSGVMKASSKWEDYVSYDNEPIYDRLEIYRYKRNE